MARRKGFEPLTPRFEVCCSGFRPAHVLYCVVILTILEDLLKQDKIVADSTVKIARSSFGMGVRAGAPKPDTSSADAFKRSLLAVKSIVITDPATGGVSGVHFVSVLQRLDIADES